VVGSVSPHSQLRGADPTLYVLSRQRAFRARYAVLTVRPGSPSTNLMPALRGLMSERARGVPWETVDVAGRIAAPLASRRFAMLVVAGFGLITLVLAGLGIHGVVSGAVERRTREMGIRIALGAAPAGVASRVIGDAMLVVAIGIAVGLIGAIAGARLLSAFLVSTPATETQTFAAAAFILVLVALAASALPALRVTRIDPVTALHAD